MVPLPPMDLAIHGEMGEFALSLLQPEDAESVVIYLKGTCSSAFLSKLGIPFRFMPLAEAVQGKTDQSRIAFLVHWSEILKQETISKYHHVYNLHPGLLPHGRGMYPVAWAIINGEEAGCTLHEIDSEKIDVGPVLASMKVPQLPGDTAETLYRRIQCRERLLLAQAFEILRVNGKFQPGSSRQQGLPLRTRDQFMQLRTKGTVPERSEDLLRIVRAFTFDQYPGLEVDIGGKRFGLRLTPCA